MLLHLQWFVAAVLNNNNTEYIFYFFQSCVMFVHKKQSIPYLPYKHSLTKHAPRLQLPTDRWARCTLVGCEGGTTGLGTGGGCETTTGAATGAGGRTVGVGSVVVWAVVIVLIAAIVFFVLPLPPSPTGVFGCKPTTLRAAGAPTGRPTFLLFFAGIGNSTSCNVNAWLSSTKNYSFVPILIATQFELLTHSQCAHSMLVWKVSITSHNSPIWLWYGVYTFITTPK